MTYGPASKVPQRCSLQKISATDFSREIEAAAANFNLVNAADILVEHLKWLKTKVEYHRSMRTQLGYQRAWALDCALQQLLGEILDND